METNHFFLLFFLLTSIVAKEALCGCSPSEYSVFANCYVEYSQSEFAKKSFTKWADVEKTCEYFWMSQECMGNSIINHCANTNGFTKYIQSQDKGALMAAQYWHLNFICGRGHEAGKKSFSCLLKKAKNCFIANSTCDLLQASINICSENMYKDCGQDGYNYLYGTFVTERCHFNPECNFLQEYCGEVSDYANAPTENEKLHNNAVLKQKTNDPETFLIARIISADKNLSTQELGRFIQKTVGLLKELNTNLFAPLWILRSLTRLSPYFNNLVVEENVIPILIKFLESTDTDLQEQSLLTLGNIVGTSSDLRDYCIQHGIIDLLAKSISPDSQIKSIRRTAWIIMNILRHEDLSLSNDDMNKLLFVLSKLIQYDDIFILTDIYCGLWPFTRKNLTNIQLLIDYGIVKYSVGHLSHDNSKIQSDALRTLTNFVNEDQVQVQYLINNGALNSMKEILKNKNKNGFIFLTNLITRHSILIEEIYNAELVPLIVAGLINDKLETKINSLNVISSIVNYGTFDHTLKLINMNTVFNLCKFLVWLKIDNVTEIRVILSTINLVLKKHMKYRSEIVKEIKDSGGMNILERLKNHENKHISRLANATSQSIHNNFSSEDIKKNLLDELQNTCIFNFDIDYFI